MKLSSFVFSLLASALAVSFPVVGAERGPSTPEERLKALELIAALESQPLGSDAEQARRQLLQWLAEIPDISVSACGEFIGPLIGVKKNHSAELMMQNVFAAAAFVIQDPQLADDEAAKQLAGMQGMLRTYESILNQEPNARLEYLDRLLERRDEGTLEEWVAERAPKCGG